MGCGLNGRKLESGGPPSMLAVALRSIDWSGTCMPCCAGEACGEATLAIAAPVSDEACCLRTSAACIVRSEAESCRELRLLLRPGKF